MEDNTIYTDQPRKWRHFAVDTTNDVLYYCDYDMKRDSMLCFASRDAGKVWIGRWRRGWWVRGERALVMPTTLLPVVPFHSIGLNRGISTITVGFS